MHSKSQYFPDNKKSLSGFTPAHSSGARQNRLEYDADCTAHKVMQQPSDFAAASPRQYASSGHDRLDPKSHNIFSNSTFPSSPIDTNTRQFMDAGFNYDFASVKIHDGTQADNMCTEINARAFTLGNNIVFGKNEYSPGTKSGKHLLAHELAHVVQQNTGQAPAMIQRQEREGVPALTTGSLTSPSMAGFIGSKTIDNFVFGESDLTEDQQAALTAHASTLTALLRDHPGGIIIITGHTDAPGEDVDNDTLGQTRADNTKAFLVSNGVDTDAILASSEGETRLRVPTTRRNPQNRRVEISFRASSPLSLGLGSGLTPPPGLNLSPGPGSLIPSQQTSDILTPPIGPYRGPQPNILDLPTIPRAPQPDLLRETSRWLTGSLGRSDIARIAAQIAGGLGMNESKIRRQLDDAMISGGEAALKEVIKRIVYAVAGTPTSRPSNEFGPIPGGDIPGTRIFNLPKIRF